MIRYLPVVLAFAFAIYSLVDCAKADQLEIRNLPKWAWILLIVVIGTLGAIAYWIAGRPRRPRPNPGPHRRILPPDDDPDFLRTI